MKIECLPVGELQTNCYLIYDGDRRGIVLDPGGEPQTILSRIAERQMDVEAVVLTHAHYDHILATPELCRALRVPLWCGRRDVPALEDEHRSLAAFFAPGMTLRMRAERSLCEGDVLVIGNERLNVWETPGHTPGSICLVGDAVIFAGDTLFAGSIGRTDFPYGDPTAMMASLRRLSALDGDRRVYPGHGGETTLAFERVGNPYLMGM